MASWIGQRSRGRSCVTRGDQLGATISDSPQSTEYPSHRSAGFSRGSVRVGHTSRELQPAPLSDFTDSRAYAILDDSLLLGHPVPGVP